MTPSLRDDRPTTRGDRSKALEKWCREEGYDHLDRDAPHVQAFLAGFGYGRERGYDDGYAKAVSDRE